MYYDVQTCPTEMRNKTHTNCSLPLQKMLSAFLVMYVHVYHKSYFYNSIATVVTFVARLVSLIARLVSFIARLVSLIARLVSLIATQD